MGLVIPLSQLDAWLASHRRAGEQIVATNGCFDVLHVGHLRYLTEARQQGDLLIVGLNGDASVKILKGENRPINGENERAELLAALNVVDVVTIFPDVRATAFLDEAKANVYVKGGDYTREQLCPEEVAAVEKHGGKIHILPLIEGRSSSRVIDALKKENAHGS